jgi:hypothetical protein
VAGVVGGATPRTPFRRFLEHFEWRPVCHVLRVLASGRSAPPLALCTAPAVLLRSTVAADEYWYINLRTIEPSAGGHRMVWVNDLMDDESIMGRVDATVTGAS